MSLEAAGHRRLCHRGGDPVIKRDFLLCAFFAPDVFPPRLCRLQDKSARGVRGTIVRQAQTNDAREDRIAAACHHDIFDVTVGEHAGASQDTGKALGRHHRQYGVRLHA